MNVSAIRSSSTTALQSVSDPDNDGDKRPSRADMKKVMDAAAKTLGMSSDDLRTALQKGQSLSDIATSKGVSQDALSSAIGSALSGGSSTTGTTGTSSSDLTSEVSKIMNHKGHGHHHHGGGGAPGAVAATTPIATPSTTSSSSTDSSSVVSYM